MVGSGDAVLRCVLLALGQKFYTRNIISPFIAVDALGNRLSVRAFMVYYFELIEQLVDARAFTLIEQNCKSNFS